MTVLVVVDRFSVLNEDVLVWGLGVVGLSKGGFEDGEAEEAEGERLLECFLRGREGLEARP